MLHRYIKQLLENCQLVDFSVRSIQALTARLNEFGTFLKSQRIRTVKRIIYRHLIDFVADYKNPSIHVRKSWVWTLRQLFHFLTLYQHVSKNIALKLPYPKIDKTAPLMWCNALGVSILDCLSMSSLYHTQKKRNAILHGRRHCPHSYGIGV